MSCGAPDLLATVTPLLSSGVRLPRGSRPSVTGTFVAIRMLAQFASSKRDGWRLDVLRSDILQTPPALCPSLHDPFVLEAREEGLLILGYQIDGGVCLHQEWWVSCPGWRNGMGQELREALRISG